LAGFLTQFASLDLPILYEQWHNVDTRFVLNYTAAGTVPDLNRIPFYVELRRRQHHQNEAKVILLFMQTKKEVKKMVGFFTKHPTI
jgi:hypothetical protein